LAQTRNTWWRHKHEEQDVAEPEKDLQDIQDLRDPRNPRDLQVSKKAIWLFHIYV